MNNVRFIAGGLHGLPGSSCYCLNSVPLRWAYGARKPYPGNTLPKPLILEGGSAILKGDEHQRFRRVAAAAPTRQGFASNSITATICSCDKWNQAIISLIEAPIPRLSNTPETGVRVSRNTHAPLRLSATCSRVTPNSSISSGRLVSCRLSNTTETGVRVPLKTKAPLRFP